jgi:glycosyltransferase involved in cell wall biosynthesis
MTFGTLAGFDEPARFSSAAIELLADASKRSALGTAGRVLAESYSWNRSAQSLIETVERVRGSGTRGYNNLSEG